MQRFFKLMISFLLIASLFIGGFAVKLIIDIRTYGTLINYVGIVRGATQRLVKLELNGEPNDVLRVYLDDIIKELYTGNGQYNLPYLNDAVYRDYLSRMMIQWELLQQEINVVRRGGSPSALLAYSETHFALANETVFAADNYANRRAQAATWLISIIVVIAASTWLGIFVYNVKRMRILEMDNRGLSDIAYIDKLTGISNLEKFKLDAQDLLLNYQNLKFAVLYVDFENFNVLNDVFGYAYGDKILQQYAQILRDDMGKFDLVCRVSADNFLILRAYTDKLALKEQQQYVDLKIAQFAISASKEQYFIRTSCGFCCNEDVVGALDIMDIIEKANFARKTAKQQGAQNYIFYNKNLRQKMLAEKAIESHMQAALEHGEFHVYFQPKVSLANGEIACAEALSRWIEEDGSIISPAEFIPIFEKNLFIVQLDQHVLRQVCHWLRVRLDNGLSIVPISVNVSRMQLYDNDFVAIYAQIKQEYNIPDYLLQVEFTESVVFERMDLLRQIISDLRVNGFLCSLDDFGKGYSSLNLLKSLPVDELKLDGLFFEETHDCERAQTVVSCVVDMAKRLNLQIVAEGVENPSQVSFLREIGCHLIQGFVFYRPMSSADFGELLQQAPISVL